MKESPDRCPLCGGDKRPGTTTFVTDLEFGIVVVRDVPATVCVQCGSDWIDDATAGRIESVVAEARAKKHQVEITRLSA